MTPPSLRRRAPVRVEVTDSCGRSPRITNGLVYVRASKRLRFKVVPQTPRDHNSAVKVEVTPSDSLKTVMTLAPVDVGPLRTWQTEVRARHKSQWPLPKKAEVNVAVSEPGCDPCNLIIPVAVWPSPLRVILWGITSVGVALFSARYLEMVKAVSPSQALLEIFREGDFIWQTLLFGFGVAGLIYVVGWLMVKLGLLTGDDG